MAGVSNIPRAALLLAGVAVGALSKVFQAPSGDSGQIAHLKKSVADLEAKVAALGTHAHEPAASEDVAVVKRLIAGVEERMAARENAQDSRLNELETRVTAHDERLKEVPSTGQIVGAMEQLLSKTMSSLDQRLSSQAHSIEVLKTTVAQTDELLERVLESLDSLRQPSSDSPDELALATPDRDSQRR